MSHIHLPDGVIPPIWWILGFAVCFLLLWLFAGKLKGNQVLRKIPFAGVIGALMLIFMSVPLGFLPVHLSLAVLCGILAGPSLSFISIFAVNTILALMGHGGFTTIGINTLLMGGEAILGFYFFKTFTGRKLSPTFSAISANIIALLLSTFLMVVLVGSSAGLSEALPFHDHDQDHTEEVHGLENNHGEDIHVEDDHDGDIHVEDDHEYNEIDVENVRFLSITGWSAVILIIFAGVLIESLVTGLIVRFFSQVRPDLLDTAIG